MHELIQPLLCTLPHLTTVLKSKLQRFSFTYEETIFGSKRFCNLPKVMQMAVPDVNAKSTYAFLLHSVLFTMTLPG